MNANHFLNRLERLAKLLMEPKPRNYTFDLSEWGTTNCKTTACACGTAALDPNFRKLGFRASIEDDLRYDVETETHKHVHAIIPTYQGYRNWEAIGAFFGLYVNNDEPGDEARYLFMPESYKRGNRRDVATRIMAFVRRKQLGIPCEA